MGQKACCWSEWVDNSPATPDAYKGVYSGLTGPAYRFGRSSFFSLCSPERPRRSYREPLPRESNTHFISSASSWPSSTRYGHWIWGGGLLRQSMASSILPARRRSTRWGLGRLGRYHPLGPRIGNTDQMERVNAYPRSQFDRGYDWRVSYCGSAGLGSIPAARWRPIPVRSPNRRDRQTWRLPRPRLLRRLRLGCCWENPIFDDSQRLLCGFGGDHRTVCVCHRVCSLILGRLRVFSSWFRCSASTGSRSTIRWGRPRFTWFVESSGTLYVGLFSKAEFTPKYDGQRVIFWWGHRPSHVADLRRGGGRFGASVILISLIFWKIISAPRYSQYRLKRRSKVST